MFLALDMAKSKEKASKKEAKCREKEKGLCGGVGRIIVLGIEATQKCNTCIMCYQLSSGKILQNSTF